MKIEYFSSDDAEIAAVLLFGNDPAGAATLAAAAMDLANGNRQHVAVHTLPGFESVDGCESTFSVGATDVGTQLVAEPNKFECIGRRASWEDVAGLLEPFCREMKPNQFQYLDDWENASSNNLQLIIDGTGWAKPKSSDRSRHRSFLPWQWWHAWRTRRARSARTGEESKT